MNRFIKFIPFVMIFGILLILILYRNPTVRTIRSLKFEDIKSAGVLPAMPQVNRDRNYNFDLGNPDHIKILKEIITQLNSGRFQGYSNQTINQKGGGPAYLILKLKDGSSIEIKAAVRQKNESFLDGSTGVSLVPIPGEIAVTVDRVSLGGIRILSTEVRKFIDGGYRNIFK